MARAMQQTSPGPWPTPVDGISAARIVGPPPVGAAFPGVTTEGNSMEMATITEAGMDRWDVSKAELEAVIAEQRHEAQVLVDEVGTVEA